MSVLESAVRALHRDLSRLGGGHALVGVLAVAAYGSPRATHDVDFAVAVADDRRAEEVDFALQGNGWEPAEHIEHEPTGRLGGVRLVRSDYPEQLRVDLLFAASGIEAEIVRDAVRRPLLRGLSRPVATRHHLIAMKVLSAGEYRLDDIDDLDVLINGASEADLALARESLALVAARGFGRDRDLGALLSEAIERAHRAAHLRQGRSS